MYKCQQCEKAYLSYPALYMHTKTKHNGPADQSTITRNRARGRPKKVRRV
jgi:hypothetical protein